MNNFSSRKTVACFSGQDGRKCGQTSQHQALMAAMLYTNMSPPAPERASLISVNTNLLQTIIRKLTVAI